MDNKEEPNEIEIVTGDDSELEISNVYDHLNLDNVRKGPDKNNIVIPKVKKNNENNDEKNESD